MKFSAGFPYRLVLTSIFFVGAFASSAWATQSANQSDVYFYPADGWHVEKNDRQMCTMSSRFNNGFTVNFDGNEKWIRGVRIDFAQDIFQTGQKYDVSLSIPGISDERFNGVGYDQATLGVDLRRGKEFYQALRQSGVLDVNVEDNDFRFYLTGFAESAMAFERCMAGADMNAESKAQYMVNESISMEEDLRARTQASASINAAAPSPSGPQRPVQSSEPRALGVSPVAGKKAPQASASAALPPSESLLQTPVKAKEPPPQAKAQKTREEEPLPVKNVEVVPVSEPVIEEHIQSSTPPMKVRKAVFSGEADFTNIEPAAAPSDPSSVRELREQVLALENTLRDLKDENLALNAELRTALKDSEEENLSIASENWNLERATMQFNEAERQIKRMGRQLQKERAKCSAEKKELEAMLFDPQVTDNAQLARLAELESQLMEARKELAAQREDYEQKTKALWEQHPGGE